MKRKTKEAEPAAPPEPARARVTVTTRDGGSRVIPAPSTTAPTESTLAPHLADPTDESIGDN